MFGDPVTAVLEIGGLAIGGTVCLVQSLFSRRQRSRWLLERESLHLALDDLHRDLNAALSASRSAQVENLVLCDLLAESNSETALRRLLQSFVPVNTAGVAAYFTRNEAWTLHDAVGIDRRQGHTVHLDPRLLGALGQERSVILSAAQLEDSQLGRSLLAALGGGIDRLYLFRTSPLGDTLDGVIATSSLPDAGDSEAERVRVVERLVAAAGRYFYRSAVAAAQEQELRMTREILELRSVVDLEFSSPQEMVEQFLSRLATVCDFDHAGVYLLRRRDGIVTRLSSSANAIAEAQLAHWELGERKVAEAAICDQKLRVHTDQQLRLLPFDVPFRTAASVPMRIGEEAAGVLCLSGRRGSALSDADRELLHWSSEYLLETIVKTVDRASIEARASRDALTGLANRHAFDDALREYVARSVRTSRDCALILFDLDHFKSVNDRYGHPAGDETLRVVADVVQEELRLHVRGTDHPLAARYGGEELAVLLPHIGLAGALRVAERMRMRVEHTEIKTHTGNFHVTLSGGVAIAPGQADDPQALVETADAALYKAKRGGRNRIVAAEEPADAGEVSTHSPLEAPRSEMRATILVEP